MTSQLIKLVLRVIHVNFFGVVSMFEVNPVINQIKEIRERTELLRGYL